MPSPRPTVLAAVAAVCIPVLLGAQRARPAGPEIVPEPATTLPLKYAPRPTTPRITAADLMTRLYIFADDSMQGREAGTIGNVRGTNYIAGELRKMGVEPAGDSGTYFQNIPLEVATIAANSSLRVGGTALAFGTDWSALSITAESRPDLPVVFGGTPGSKAGVVAPAAMQGRFVIFSLGPGVASFRPIVARAHSAAVIGIIAPPTYLAYGTRPTQFLDDPAEPPAMGRTPVVLLTAASAARFFTQPVDRLAPGAAGTAASIDLRVDVAPVPYPARNVIGIVRGSDPALAGEYVAIGAHNDHIGFNHTPVDHDSLRIFNHIVRPLGLDTRTTRATPAQMAEVNRELAAWRHAHPGTARLDSIDNGADDDGSGTVTALEIAQKVMSLHPHPKRSLLFVWHEAEEKGLLGSTYFTDHPTVPRDSIVAQLNMDMVGRGDAWDVTGTTKNGAFLHGGPHYLLLVGTRRLSTELGDLIERVNREDHHGFVFDYSMDANGHPENVYCRSDHYEYARYGIPIAFFTTGLHSDYHQVTDEPEYIDYAHMARVARLVEDVAVHVADLDHRVVVDHPRPDPHGACHQ